MQKIKLLSSLFFLSLSLIAWGEKLPDSTKIYSKLSGFVNSQLFYDSRQLVESREAMVSLYPKNAAYDSDNQDINAKPSLNQLSMTTRMHWEIKGPMVMKAKPFVWIEGDFTGSSNADNNGFRLREAVIRLEWQKIAFTTGQTWHLIDVTDCRPNLISLNTGSPFHPFSRHNQLKIEYFTLRWKVLLSANSQRDYANDGPDGISSVYLRNAVIPNLHLQLQYAGTHLKSGIGLDFKILKPSETAAFSGKVYKSDSKVSSWALVGYFKYNQSRLSIKTFGIIGKNLSEHLMIGGYYLSAVDTINHRINYNTAPVYSTWLQTAYEWKHISVSMFGGYTRNLPYPTKNQGVFYGRNPDIRQVYRWMPSVNYTIHAFRVGAELECTTAYYGLVDVNGHFAQTEAFTNYRFLLGIFYFF